MELKIQDGDYVPDGIGGLETVDGTAALVQRVLYRLQVRRGSFPFLTDMGSCLWKLGALSPAERSAAAKQYVAEALADEKGLSVKGVTLEDGEDGTAVLTAELAYSGENLSVELTVR